MSAATTTVTLVEYLAEKGVRTFKASGPEITAWCFFCNRHQRDKGRLYINTAEGIYYCQVCMESGTYRDILEHFGDEPTTVASPGSDDMLARRRLLEAATVLGETGLGNNDDAMLWLMGTDRRKKQRGLKPDTIIAARLGFLGRGWSLKDNLAIPHEKKQLLGTGLVWKEDGEHHRAGDDFFRGPKVLIPYISSGSVVQVRGRDWPEGKYQTGPGESIRLYGTDSLRGADEAIIVEGEFDAMVLRQALALATDGRWRRMAVVALPGAGSWDKSWVDYFRDCKRVFVALDPDEAGQKGAIKVKEALGSRARVVDLPDDLPKCDWTEYLIYRQHPVKDVIALLSAAQSVGRRLYSFSEAYDSHLKVTANQEVYPTGYTMLDAAIDGGGLTPGSVTVVAAKTGAGKTLFAGNVVVNQRRAGLDIPTLFVSLEMTKAELAERLVRQWRFYDPYADDDLIRKTFDDHLMICDENRLAGRDVAALIEEFEDDKGEMPKFIVVDYLGYFARGQQGNGQYEKVTNAVMELKALAKDSEAALLVPAQVNRIAKDGQPIDADSLRDSGAIEETADYLITLWRPDDALEPGEQVERTGDLMTSLVKNRRGPKGQKIKLRYAHGSLAIVDPTDAKASFQVTAENKMIWAGKTYADVRSQYAQQRLALVT